MLRISCLILLLPLVLAACLAAQPGMQYEVGDLLLEEPFDSVFDWEQYSDPALQVTLGVEEGAYRIRARDGGFMWGLNRDVHTDVIIEAEVTQQSTYADNAFGIMCRADPDADGDGYYFFISGDGQFTIRRGRGDEVLPLIAWTPTAAITQGRSRNRLRVVCVDDYLALYVNDDFVAETRDRLFSAGVAGLVAAVPEAGEVDVIFDDLLIFSAHLVGSG